MNHNPYQNWILEDIDLSTQQSRELNEHLKTCSTCTRLYNNWQAAAQTMKKNSMVSPRPGFTASWQSSLPERHIRQQRRSVLRFFLYMGGANIFAMLVILGLLVSNYAWLSMLVSGLQGVTAFVIWFTQLQHYVISLLNIMPPFIPIALWVLLTSVLSILTVAWSITLWRISLQGLQNK